jgi:two-component system phosphate regulon response regulator PhoB
LRDLLEFNLGREGFVVTAVPSAEAGRKVLQQQPHDLVLLDLMLPGMDGLEFCRLLKSREETANLPIVMLTAKGEEADVVAGLELGADDYITKPFSPRVLLARVKALLRRGQGVTEDEESTSTQRLAINEVELDPDRHEVRVYGQTVNLTATEFKMLHLLMGRPGRVFTRQQIIEAIHGRYAAVTDRSVDVQIVTLRRKMGEAGSEIETVRGVGYRYRD